MIQRRIGAWPNRALFLFKRGHHLSLAGVLKYHHSFSLAARDVSIFLKKWPSRAMPSSVRACHGAERNIAASAGMLLVKIIMKIGPSCWHVSNKA